MTINSASSVNRLKEELSKFASGQERTLEGVERIGELAAQLESVPWRDELVFLAGHYVPNDEATGDEALAALAQIVLDDWAKKRSEPRWRLRLPADAKGLQKRWLDEAGRERADAVSRALATGRLADVAFGMHDGRLDLRGFVDPSIERYQRWLRGLQDRSIAVDHPGNMSAGNLDHVDFSGAKFDSLQFLRKGMNNCRFDGVDFRDFRLWSSTVSNTSFRGTRFGDVPVLDGVSWWPRRCTFERVDFTDANLAGVIVNRARFEDCDFSRARLTRAMFECDLIRCRFAGHLCDVAFIGRRWTTRRQLRIEDVDLSGAELHFVGFRAVDLAAFRLPVDPNIRVVSDWPCVYARLNEEFGGKPDELVPLSVRLALIHEPGGLPVNGAMVLELGTIGEDTTAEDVAQLELLLDRAEAACRA